MNKNLKNKGRFLTLVLRHSPEKIGLTLDYNGGWGNVEVILKEIGLTLNELELIVKNDNKNRFSFNEDKTKIRANQGHSVNVDLQLNKATPPNILLHGTATRFLPSIRKEGLKSMSRHHVHLTENEETAKQVGGRYGEVYILKIDAKQMIEDNIEFYLSENGVWLTEKVLSKYFLN